MNTNTTTLRRPEWLDEPYVLAHHADGGLPGFRQAQRGDLGRRGGGALAARTSQAAVRNGERH